MSIILIILKIIFLFLAIRWTIVNTGNMLYKCKIPSMNIVTQTVGIVGFIVIQFKLYE